MHMLHICEGMHWSHCQQTGKCATASIVSQAAASFRVICTLRARRLLDCAHLSRPVKTDSAKSDRMISLCQHTATSSYWGGVVGKHIRRAPPFTVPGSGDPTDMFVQKFSSAPFSSESPWIDIAKQSPPRHTWELYISPSPLSLARKMDDNSSLSFHVLWPSGRAALGRCQKPQASCWVNLLVKLSSTLSLWYLLLNVRLSR